MATLSDADHTATWGWREWQARLERYLLTADEIVRLNRFAQRFSTDLTFGFRGREVPALANLVGWWLARILSDDDVDADAAISRLNDILQLSAMRADAPRLELRYAKDEGV